MSVMQIVRKADPVTFPLPSPAEQREARALNLEERARAVEQAGEPILQSFRGPSFRDLQHEEHSQADRITQFAAQTIFGVSSVDRLTPRQANDLEGGAMYLVRRSEPSWLQAAREHAVETLMASDEFRLLMRERSYAESRLIAHRLATAVRAAEIGVLENSVSVAPAVYLKLAAAQMRSGAR